MCRALLIINIIKWIRDKCVCTDLLICLARLGYDLSWARFNKLPASLSKMLGYEVNSKSIVYFFFLFHRRFASLHSIESIWSGGLSHTVFQCVYFFLFSSFYYIITKHRMSTDRCSPSPKFSTLYFSFCLANNNTHTFYIKLLLKCFFFSNGRF